MSEGGAKTIKNPFSGLKVKGLKPAVSASAKSAIAKVKGVPKAAAKTLHVVKTGATTAAQTAAKGVTTATHEAAKGVTTATHKASKEVTTAAQTAAHTAAKGVTTATHKAAKGVTTATHTATKGVTTAAQTAAHTAVKGVTTAAQKAATTAKGIQLPQTSALGFTKGSIADTAAAGLVNKIEQAGKATLAGTVKQVTGLSTTTAGKLAALDQQFATTTKSTYSLSSMFSSLKTSVYNFYVNIPVAIGNFITRLRQWDASAWSWTLLVTFIFLIIFYFTSGFTAWTLADANKKAKSVSNQLTVLNDRMAILSSFSKLQKEFFTDMAKAKQVDPSTLSMLDIQPQTIKQIGYLGPQPEGTFDAEDATAQALLAGIRSFVFQIDYLDKTLNNKFAPPGIPCLLYRADDGALVSKNSADISKVAETLANLAFRPESPNHAAPLILYLHIRRAPSILREPDEYKEFLSRIATGLKPLAPQHLGMSPLGIFHRQKQESVLVSTPLKAFEGQVIILCNADTSVFRKGTRIDPADDLDYWVNMRVYLGDPKDTIGITQAAAPGVTPQAVIMNLANVSSMTEKQMDDFAITAKRAFIIAMPSQASNPTTTVLDTALNKLGIHMIPLDIFSHDIEETKSLIAEYNGMPFRSKAAFLRNSS